MSDDNLLPKIKILMSNQKGEKLVLILRTSSDNLRKSSFTDNNRLLLHTHILIRTLEEGAKAEADPTRADIATAVEIFTILISMNRFTKNGYIRNSGVRT